MPPITFLHIMQNQQAMKDKQLFDHWLHTAEEHEVTFGELADKLEGFKRYVEFQRDRTIIRKV